MPKMPKIRVSLRAIFSMNRYLASEIPEFRNKIFSFK